jgi:hypothetical protein
MRARSVSSKAAAAPLGTTIPRQSLRRIITGALPLAIALVTAGACTHFTPYYRGKQPHGVDAVEDAAVDHRLLLIGDAGDPDRAGEPALQLLAHQVQLLPERTTVVFLGDNVYERGMPTLEEKPVGEQVAEVVAAPIVNISDDREAAERIINAQIDAVRGSAARAIFVPGNHDWDPFEDGGWGRVVALQDFIAGVAEDGKTHVSLLPTGGCPGPVAVSLGRTGELIVLDTEWWLEAGPTAPKPAPDDNPTRCQFTTEQQVRDALEKELESAAKQKRWAIVVAHHPMDSRGSHGGFLDARTHIFPFQVARHYVPFYIEWIPIPIVGSLVVAARNYASPSPEDMVNRHYRHMRNALMHSMEQAADKQAAPLAYAGGHDHSLQVFESRHGPEYSLVSGLGCHSRASDVGDNSHTLFAHANPFNPGFMQIDFLKNGAVRLAVIEWSKEQPNGTEVYSTFLAEPGSVPGVRPDLRHVARK